MTKFVRIAAVALAALMAAPAASAIWKVDGSFEPDTEQDISDGFMFDAEDALDPEAERVYFNVVPHVYFSGVNPNPGDRNGARLHNLMESYHAYLGVWKDCNRDGYLGLGAAGLLDYTVAEAEAFGTPVDDELCPVEIRQGSTYDPENALVHNDGSWIVEYVPIGPGDDTVSYEQTVQYINDSQALVWGDYDLPNTTQVFDQTEVDPNETEEDENNTDTGGTCKLFLGYDRGTFASTGGLLNFVDCNLGREVATTINCVADGTSKPSELACVVPNVADEPFVTTVDSVAPSAPAGAVGDMIRFDDPYAPQKSDSVLNQHFPVNLFGDPYAGDSPTGGDLVNGVEGEPGNPFAGGTEDGQRTGLLQKDSRKNNNDPGSEPDRAFHTWDCSSGTTHVPGVPVHTPGQIGDPTGVISRDPDAFGYHDDGEGSDVYMPGPGVDNVHGSYYDGLNDTWAECDYSGSGLSGLYPAESVEDNTNASATTISAAPAKRTNDWNFAFSMASSPHQAYQVEDLLGDRTPNDFGILLARQVASSPIWTNAGGSVLYPPTLFRENIDLDEPSNSSVEFPQARFVTFYARVGAVGPEALPHDGDGIYASEICQGNNQDIVGGWDCDGTHWYNTAYGGSEPPTDFEGRPVGAPAGTPYQLRDIDCYDGRAGNDVPVGTETAALGTHPCLSNWS